VATRTRSGLLLWGTAGGVVIGVVGFGAMTLLSHVTSYPSGLRTLDTFRSATWGDGLLLPLLVASLLWSTGSLPPARGERAIAWLGTAVGAGVGLLTQIVWLADPHPATNWTLTSAHHFDFAGWYHACFLVTASGVIAGLFCWVAARLVAADPVPAFVRGSLAVAVLASSGFVVALSLDNVPSPRTVASSATTSAVVVAVGAFVVAAVVIVVLRWMRRRRGGQHPDLGS
jgi:hypothetical protein